MTDALDYERLGRQIALADLGESGQRALAATPVAFTGSAPGVATATRIAVRAGMAPSATASAPLTVAVPEAQDEDARLVASAWAVLESARRVLGLAPRAAIPHDIAARMKGDAR